jgi:hypothetical protein
VDHSPLMGEVERARDLPSDRQGLRHAELFFPVQPSSEGLATDVGQDIPEEAVAGPGVEQGDDVGMVEAGGRSGSR